MSYVFNSCRPHHKKGNLIRGFLFCFVVDSRANCIIICSWRSITFRYSVGLRPPYTREIRQTKNNYFTQAVPYFNALPLRQIPVENTIPGRSFSLSFAQIASWALFRRACALLTPTTKMRYLCELASINASFFCIFDVFMRSKTHFFAIYPQFWRPHLNIIFFLWQKLSEIFSRRAFYLLKFKLYQIHLRGHELVRKVRINSSNKTFGTIPHPSIYNIRSYILYTSRRKGMSQKILRNFFVLHNSLKHMV